MRWRAFCEPLFQKTTNTSCCPQAWQSFYDGFCFLTNTRFFSQALLPWNHFSLEHLAKVKDLVNGLIDSGTSYLVIPHTLAEFNGFTPEWNFQSCCMKRSFTVHTHSSEGSVNSFQSLSCRNWYRGANLWHTFYRYDFMVGLITRSLRKSSKCQQNFHKINEMQHRHFWIWFQLTFRGKRPSSFIEKILQRHFGKAWSPLMWETRAGISRTYGLPLWCYFAHQISVACKC